MKIKKYTGKTEKDAILKVKEELGGEALIVSVKSVKPRGIFKLFRKPYVEVTAAIDDRVVKQESVAQFTEISDKQKEEVSESLDKNFKEEIKEEKPAFEMRVGEEEFKLEEKSEKDLPKSAEFIKALYRQLIENEVLEQHVNMLTQGAHELEIDESKEIVALVYKRIIDILSDYQTINKKDNKVVFFVGPTGVGKTTTIAKVASYFLINQELRVALITADTYRIAAVEQLRTYADILNIPIKVIYSDDELGPAIEEFSHYDLIFVDTAGRSHKNEERHLELSKMLDSVDEKDVYLVLSAATKYKDLKSIANKYSAICDYKIIFTKLDETMSYGNILNTKLLTGAKLSYVTFGQSVPEDISTIKPHQIAKNILGGVD